MSYEYVNLGFDPQRPEFSAIYVNDLFMAYYTPVILGVPFILEVESIVETEDQEDFVDWFIEDVFNANGIDVVYTYEYSPALLGWACCAQEKQPL